MSGVYYAALAVRLDDRRPDVTLNSHHRQTADETLIHIAGEQWSLTLSGTVGEIRQLACRLLDATIEVDDDMPLRVGIASLRTALASAEARARLAAAAEPDVEGVGV